MTYRVMTPRPDRRPALLYRRWRDLQSRCKGQATQKPELYANLRLGFANYAEFRAFAVSHGFSKHNDSPDRIDSSKGYVPGNIRFIPNLHNRLRALYPNRFDYYAEQFADRYAASECDCGAEADPHDEGCPLHVPF